MNRPIKFRAWDNHYRKLFQVSMNDYNTGDFFDDDRFIVMQFTGLKDKNGKEIYEGDVLEFDADEWGDDKGNRFVVSWNERDGKWNTGGGTNSECSSFKTVIGNIYENPELLT